MLRNGLPALLLACSLMAACSESQPTPGSDGHTKVEMATKAVMKDVCVSRRMALVYLA